MSVLERRRRGKYVLVERAFLILVDPQWEVGTHLNGVEEGNPGRCEPQEERRDEHVHHSEEERYLNDLISPNPSTLHLTHFIPQSDRLPTHADRISSVSPT